VPAAVLAAVRAPFAALGAPPLNAPVVQPLSLYLDLAGEALRERLFLVQVPGAEEACLRPDFTLGAVQAHIASGAAAGRYVYEGPAFRIAPPRATRAEQFLQIGVEVFEDGDPARADAALAALAWRAAAAGARDDLTLLFGDIALFAAFIDALDVAPPLAMRLKRAFSSPDRLNRELTLASRGEAAPRARLTDLLLGLPEADAAGVLEEIWSLAGIEPVGGRSAAEIVHRITLRAALDDSPRLTAGQGDMIARFLAISETPPAALAAVTELAGGAKLAAALEAWDRRLAALDQEGVPAGRMRLATAFGRAFGYYDGVLFEVRSPALGEDQPVAAGGRYDSLPARLGASLATGAVGCMVRPGRAWREGRP